jgi:hypothetical protein
VLLRLLTFEKPLMQIEMENQRGLRKRARCMSGSVSPPRCDLDGLDPDLLRLSSTIASAQRPRVQPLPDPGEAQRHTSHL